MKQLINALKKYAPWLILLLIADGFSALLLWLSDAGTFRNLIGIILLWSLILFSAVLGFTCIKEQKKAKYFRSFITNPDEINEEKLLRSVSAQERQQLKYLVCVLRDNQQQLSRMKEDLLDYEEYVEGWAHEAKTPLSLLTMLLDNHADELPAPLHAKLDYSRSCLQEDVTQMLYYARLKSSTKDYRFEPVALRELLQEVLEDYAPLLEEKQFCIRNSIGTETVYTDRRGLQFMLGQIVSNAIKYSSSDPMLTFTLEREGQEDMLTVADNGTGVKPYDLPYIFQKGFTGDSTDSRKKATGMGLYLTRKMADDLNLRLDADSRWGEGFSISIVFPRVDRT